MTVSHRTQAVLLLTSVLPGAPKEGPKPLTPTEWSRLAKWLHSRGVAPEALLTDDSATVLADWEDERISIDRVIRLVERGAALALAMDEWERAGVWVLTRSDPGYPRRLRDILKADSPPVLFGCGPKELLNQGGIAVVGSRNAGNDDLSQTREIGAVVASNGRSIVSGGARGVDETAMLSALEAEGTAVGVLADDLLRTASSKKYRRYILSGDLVLVSAVHPKARFDVRSAMGRNKYIYALADRAVVVTTTEGKGGTWSGATENLKRGWVPLYVLRGNGPDQAKEVLVRAGATWLYNMQDIVLEAQVADQPTKQSGTQVPSPTGGVTDTPDLFSNLPSRASPTTAPEMAHTTGDPANNPKIESAQEILPGVSSAKQMQSLYELFLFHIESASSEAQSEDVLLEALGLERGQFRAWVTRAIEEGRVEKLARPTRYVWSGKAAD